MDVALRYIPHVSSKINSIVSILVLVDVALRFQTMFFCILIIHSFNPCFSGCRPAILCHPCHRSSDTAVSILVLVDVALRWEKWDEVYFYAEDVSILVLVDVALR